jgi:hypothetical protein
MVKLHILGGLSLIEGWWVNEQPPVAQEVTRGMLRN